MSQPLPDGSDPIAPMLSTAQIITAALAMGVATFLVIAALVVRSGKLFAPDPWSVSLLAVPALGVAALALAGSAVIPGLIVNSRRKALARGQRPEAMKQSGSLAQPADAYALMALYSTRQIVAAALLEGAAFFNGVVYMIEGSALCLVAALVLLGVLLARFPTRPAVDAWLDGQMTQLDQERQQGWSG